MVQNTNPRLVSKVLDLLLDVVCVVDVDGRFVFVSAASERVFGYSPAEMMGRNMIDFVFADDRERTLEAANLVMRDQPRPHFENRYVRKDGETVDIMWSARWSAADGVRLAVARDVTALRHAERKQRALYEIAEAAHSADGLPALYQRVHGIIRKLLPADDLTVAHYDQATDTLSTAYHEPGLAQAEPQRSRPDGPMARVIHEGVPVLARSLACSDAARTTPTPLQGEHGDWLGVPLIASTGVIGALVLESRSETIRYAEKDKELLHFVSNQIADAIERKQTEIRLHRLALHDALTGLPNRTLFNDRFDVALRQANRNGECLAVLFLDLDGFKRINDGHGHETGDQLLCEVAQRLVRSVREADTVGRMGGDEFTVLLTGLRGADEVQEVAGKLAACFAEPFVIAGTPLSVSVSVGSAVYPEHGEDRQQLVRHADSRMFAVKRKR